MVEPHLKGHGELRFHDTKGEARWVKKYLVCYKDTPKSVGRIDIFPDESCYEQSRTQCCSDSRKCYYFNRDTTCDCDDKTVTIRHVTNTLLLKFDGSHEATRWATICNSTIMEMAERGKNVQPRKSDADHVTLDENDPQYEVTVKENDASKAAGITGKHVLVVGAEGIGLQALRDASFKAYWNYIGIRRYGAAKDAIWFECGRGAPTGPGYWELVSTMAKSVVATIKKQTTLLNKKMKGEKETLSVPEVKVKQDVASGLGPGLSVQTHSQVYETIDISSLPAGQVSEHHYQELGVMSQAEAMSSVYSQLTLDDRAGYQEHPYQPLGISDDLSKGPRENQGQEPTYENLDDDYLVPVSTTKKD